MDWISVQDRLPETDVIVEARTPGGDERELLYDRNLWWLPDKAMYVYFVPTHWRPLQVATGGPGSPGSR